MLCQKIRLSSLLLGLLLLAFAAGSSQAGKRDDLYKEGNKAFESKDHVTALKKLYAFYVLNQEEIESNPEFKRKIEERISYSESLLTISFSSNPSVQWTGRSFRVLTEGDGTVFTGTGKEIQDLLNSKTIDLDAIKSPAATQ